MIESIYQSVSAFFMRNRRICMSYFIFNGISSESMGIRIKSKNVYSAPKYDVTLTTIPGRDGDLISPNGRFGNVSVSYTCFLPAKSIAELSEKLTKVKNWLYTEPNKYHDLTDSYDVRFMRKALFNSKLDISDECMKMAIRDAMIKEEKRKILKKLVAKLLTR